MVLQTPFYFFLSRKRAWMIPKNWGRTSNWLLKHVVGTKLEITGLENIPEGGFIIAAKHQSFWDIPSLLHLFDDPAFILKKELMSIPFFGWYVAKLDMIPIRRGDKSKALKEMMYRAKQEIARGRQIMIYPEGTRRSPGAEPAYKYGIARLYEQLDCPVLPIALNSGLYWPRRKFLRYPGTIRVEILPPIQPGMEPQKFFKHLQDTTESACHRLYQKAAMDISAPPISDSVKKIITELQNSK